MRFRNFISVEPKSPLLEADLLGTPSNGASTPAPSQSNPSGQPKSDSNDRPDGNSAAGGAARPPHQLQRAVTLATKLQKLLATRPHPLNKNFHAFQQPLQAFLDRLQQITQA